MRISQKVKRCYNVKSSVYLSSCEDRDIGRFQVCISVPLQNVNAKPKVLAWVIPHMD